MSKAPTNNEKGFFTLAAMEKVIRKAGAARVSEGAKSALKEILEEKAVVIAGQSVKLASHAKRRTIKAEDVKMAVR